MSVSTEGTGERSLYLSYISEVPVWKATYRIVLNAKSKMPLLQGWAIVDNTVGQDWDNDVRVVLFVRLRDGLALDDALAKKIKDRIRVNTTPRHVPAKVVQVADIPRTKSGKIVELAVRNVVHGQPVKNLEALANPEVLEQFRDRPELASP